MALGCKVAELVAGCTTRGVAEEALKAANGIDGPMERRLDQFTYEYERVEG